MPTLLPILMAASPAAQFAEFEVLSTILPDAKGIQVVDIDGDGQQDIVAGSGTSGEILVWIGEVGPTSFDQPKSAGFAPGPIREIRTADLDRDGDQDLCVVTDGPAVSWMENLGGTAFAMPVTVFAMNAVLPDAAARIRLVDMDGDGWTDVLTCLDRGASPVVICTNDGGGAFTVQVVVTVVGSIFDVDAGDFDSDGDVDIVAAGPDEALVFHNDGAGTFTAADVLPAPPGSPLSDSRVSVHDQNTDGTVDVVVTRSSTSFANHVFYRGHGDGTFADPFTLRVTTQRLLDYRFGDFDGNGVVDLVEALASPGERVIVSPGIAGGGLDVARLVSRERIEVVALMIGDSDQDGFLELYSGTESGTVTRRSEDPGVPGPDFALDVHELTATSFAPLRALSADLNGDGMAGLVTVSSDSARCTWWPTDGAGGFLPPRVIFEYSGDRELPQAVDLDGDGDLDIVRLLDAPSPPAWYENDGQGGFAARVELAGFTPTFPDAGQDLFVDLNGDGIPEWVRTSSTSNSQLQWQAGLGGGAFGPPRSVDPTGDIRSNTVAMDLDGNGSLDLVHRVGRTGINGPARWIGHLNDGAGNPSPGQVVGAITSAQADHDTSLLVVGDFDGDGLQDLLCRSNETQGFGGVLSVHHGSGTGQLGPEQIVETPATAIFEVGVLDVDGDGNDDIVVDGSLFPVSPNGVVVYRSRGTRSFLPRQTIYQGFGLFAAIATGDADGDGDDDVYLAGVRNDDVGIVRSLARGNLGVPYCLDAVPNSTGAAGELQATGSALLSQPSLRLSARSVPPQAFGLFVTSQTTASVMAQNSVGILCLGGAIGRFTGPGQVVQADASGQFGIDANPAALPTPMGPESALPGSTWHFQAWHRDTSAGMATSNFTSALSVTFL